MYVQNFCITVYVSMYKNTYCFFFIWEWEAFIETSKENSQIYSILFYMVKKPLNLCSLSRYTIKKVMKTNAEMDLN